MASQECGTQLRRLPSGRHWEWEEGVLSLLTSVNQSATAVEVQLSVVKEDLGDGVRGAPAGKRAPSDY